LVQRKSVDLESCRYRDHASPQRPPVRRAGRKTLSASLSTVQGTVWQGATLSASRWVLRDGTLVSVMRKAADKDLSAIN
jgi:hypothetical protein